MKKIKFAENDAETKNCFYVMKKLHRNLKDESNSFQKIKKQMEIADFKLVFRQDKDDVRTYCGN